jgi:hypothetical protein
LGADDSESREAGAREYGYVGYATTGGAGTVVREYGAAEPAGPVAGGSMLFAGASGSHAEPAGADELDIPAFLRRGR